MWEGINIRQGDGIPTSTAKRSGAAEEVSTAAGQNGLNTTIKYPDGRDATILVPQQEYDLFIGMEYPIFLGSVALMTSKTIFAAQLFEPDNCINTTSDQNVECNFTQPSLAADNKPFFRLGPVPVDKIVVDEAYILNITWSHVRNPLKLWQLPNDSDRAKEGFMTSIEHFLKGQPSGASEPPPRPSNAATGTESSTSSTESRRPSFTIADFGGTATNSTSTTTSDPSSTASSHDASSQQNKDGGSKPLGNGAKAGIAVGAVLGVFLIVALIFLCLRRRRSERKTAGGYYGDAPGSFNDMREKEAGVGIVAIPVSVSPTSDRHHSHNGDAVMLGQGNSRRVVDGASLEREDVGGHAAPVAGVGAAGVARKPIGSRGVSDEEAVGGESAMSSHFQVLSGEERARWEEEERRLDEDIAEAERRRLAQ